jgi:hypothetical protein
MSNFAVVVMLPNNKEDPMQVDFAAREFTSWQQVPGFMAEVEAKVPNWRLVSFCHVEDLPMLMEPPDGNAR